MYFLNEGNDDNVESLINFDKFRMISKYIKVGSGGGGGEGRRSKPCGQLSFCMRGT